MPRKRNAVPSYRKHSSGRARVTVNGRDFLLPGLYDSQESRRAYAKLIAEYAASEAPASFAPGSVSVAALLDDYYSYAERYYGTAPESEYHRMRPVLRKANELFGDMPAAEFGPKQYKAVRQAFVDEGCARSYINRLMQKLVRAFKWGVSEEIVEPTVLLRLKAVDPLKFGRSEAKETEPVPPVAQKVIDATVKHATPTLAAMIQIQLLTGARPAEICRLTPGMIDRSGEVWVAELKKHKTKYRKKRRFLLFGPKAQEILLPYLLRGENEPCFSPAQSERERRQMIPRKTPMNQGNRAGYSKHTRNQKEPQKAPGRQWNTQSYGRAIKAVCRRHDIPEWAPNQLRHTAATTLREQFGLDTAGAVLGHANLNVTQVYAEQSLQKAAFAIAQIG